jgi:hypothetical protein
MHVIAPATAAAPLACVAARRGGTSRARKNARLAAVLSEFGYRTYVAHHVDDDPSLDPEARLVVCDIVNPAGDLPCEVVLAAMRGLDVVALVPAGVPVAGYAGGLLADCGAKILRYEGVEPHRVLHAELLTSSSPAAPPQRR